MGLGQATKPQHLATLAERTERYRPHIMVNAPAGQVARIRPCDMVMWKWNTAPIASLMTERPSLPTGRDADGSGQCAIGAIALNLQFRSKDIFKSTYGPR
jgi:hypothetical protein